MRENDIILDLIKDIINVSLMSVEHLKINSFTDSEANVNTLKFLIERLEYMSEILKWYIEKLLYIM